MAQINGNTCPVHGWEDLSNVNMSILSKEINISNAIPIKTPNGVFKTEKIYP